MTQMNLSVETESDTERLVVAKAEMGGRQLNSESGISRYKLVNTELINTKVLPCSTGNYI